MASTRDDFRSVHGMGIRRRSAFSCVALLLACLCFATRLPYSAHGQEPVDESSTFLLANEHSPAAREQMFAELARDVAALEQRLSIVKRVVHLVGPSVVHIEAEKNGDYSDSYGTTDKVTEAGSGILISLGERIYILTNRHVIRDARLRNISIRLHDGRILRPEKVWEDFAVREGKEEGTDVAVLAIPNVVDLVPARLGDSSQVEIGDFVLAVGSPFGLSQSVTYGIVSAMGRHDLDLGEGEVKYQNFLQTDAAINPGNSGGPLINLRGEVIGLNTAIASSSGGNEGIGFSIPINTAVHIARELVEHGQVARAYLGVTLDSGYSGSAARFAADGARYVQGARVTQINDRAPAAGADIQVGDIVLFFDGIRIKDADHLINVVGLTEVGREVSLGLLRNGETKAVRVRLGEKPDLTTQTQQGQR